MRANTTETQPSCPERDDSRRQHLASSRDRWGSLSGFRDWRDRSPVEHGFCDSNYAKAGSLFDGRDYLMLALSRQHGLT